jgi:hypothetical protein
MTKRVFDMIRGDKVMLGVIKYAAGKTDRNFVSVNSITFLFDCFGLFQVKAKGDADYSDGVVIELISDPNNPIVLLNVPNDFIETLKGLTATCLSSEETKSIIDYCKSK